MLSDDRFREIYDLLDAGQTVDDEGDPLNCGGPCGQHCCAPALTKYLLPGEDAFLEREMQRLRARPFRFVDLQFYVAAEFTQAVAPQCMCLAERQIRPFVCRVFPFVPVVDGRRVVGLRKNQRASFAPCWITHAGELWAHAAVRAWQLVLDDLEARFHFVKLGTLWEWNRAIEDGHDPGPVLLHLAALKPRDDAATWSLAQRFFERTERSAL